MNEFINESITYIMQFLPFVFTIRDVPIIYHILFFNHCVIQLETGLKPR
jgi:hypothetical protein